MKQARGESATSASGEGQNETGPAPRRGPGLGGGGGGGLGTDLLHLRAHASGIRDKFVPALEADPSSVGVASNLGWAVMQLDVALAKIKAASGADVSEIETEVVEAKALAAPWLQGASGDAPVQRRASGESTGNIHEHAQAGISGAGEPIPHADAIQRAFGPHDVSGIRAHVGGAAANASAAIGAEAYATGSDVAFASSPSLFVAAHEAAHVVQQRAGVSLLGGVGEAGDSYEQHADAVAERVVRGESAAELLGAPAVTSGGSHVQCWGIPVPDEFDVTHAISEAERRAAIDAEPRAARLQRTLLITDIAAQSASVMDLQMDGVENAVGKLGDAPKKTASSFGLVDLAAAAAIGSLSSFVALSIAEAIAINGVSKEATDAIKEMTKSALKAGIAATRGADDDKDLLREFAETQVHKLRAAKAAMTHAFLTSKADALAYLELNDLQRIADQAALLAQLQQITTQQEQATSIEWINLLARAHHGAGAWESSEGADRIPTGAALHGEAAEKTAARSNVSDSGSATELVYDQQQRKFQDDHYGLLEISLGLETLGHLEDGMKTEFWLYTHTGYGIRMDHVNEFAKAELRKAGTVAAARVNKIIRLYWDFDLNPPAPQHAILVTADGYIRAQSVHESVPESVSTAAVRYADALSLEHLK